ncbi:MAG TPA: MogA/MoaB family molybdenum cofactor biosynthesis protein [Polyangia bacterium]|jgi:molybdenum cofactor biosynthesis protein B
MPADEHRAQAPSRVRVFVLTVSDTRTPATDTSGQAARELCEGAGHEVVGYRILKDEPAEVRALVAEVCAAGAVDAVLVNGGTGLSRRDSTYEALAGLLDKRLDGFGELFRALSFQQIGPAAMLSRAVAGVHAGVAVFATPGSTAAVRLALEQLILPELGHVVREVRR